MSAQKGKDKSVLADKQKFGEDAHAEHDSKQEHEAKDKVAHMGEQTQPARPQGTARKQP